MNAHQDREFWTSLTWPAAPNQDDYNIFEQYCQGRVLLLGSTRLLLPLCTEAWDLEPCYPDEKIKRRDWAELDEHWDTIIIDGGIAFGQEFTRRLLRSVLPNCDRFVARSFLNPTWKTKYATWFPRAQDFDTVPAEHPVNDIYTFYIWNKDQQY